MPCDLVEPSTITRLGSIAALTPGAKLGHAYQKNMATALQLCWLCMRLHVIACLSASSMVLQALDKQLPKLEEGSSASAFSMENVLAEVEDLLSYCNDILCTGTPLLTAFFVQTNPHL